MSETPVSLAASVQDSFRRLSVSAAELNSASDRLGASITALEGALKRLGLGISSWYSFVDETSRDGASYWSESIGYTKMAGKWGLAISTRSGREVMDEDNVEIWPFNESPRHLRLKALKFIPQLLDKLNKDAVDFVAKVVDGTSEIDLLTAAISSLDPAPAKLPSSEKTLARKGS